MNKKQAYIFLLFNLVICVALIFLFTASAGAANIATAGQDDGYSGRILDKITKKWKPPHPLGKYRLNIVLAVEGDGNLADCRIQKSSGLEALDVSACAAARAAAPFGQPPYGMPASIFFSFWSDNDSTPRTNPDPQAPDSHLAMREREAAIAANERAQAAAQLAAKKTGKKLPISEKTGKDTANLAESSSSRPGAGSQAHHAAARATKLEDRKIATVEKDINKKPPVSPVNESGERSADAVSPSPVITSEMVIPAGVDANRYARYISRLRWDLRNKMYIPLETRPGTYHALVEIKCDKNGRITSSSMLKGSGDEILDRYVMQGIKRAGKVVPPAPGFGNTFKIDFTLVRN